MRTLSRIGGCLLDWRAIPFHECLDSVLGFARYVPNEDHARGRMGAVSGPLRRFFMASKGDRRLALFIENCGDAAPNENVLLVPEYNSQLVEALSPGGWQDCPNATERKWGLLVGHADAKEEHGLVWE